MTTPTLPNIPPPPPPAIEAPKPPQRRRWPWIVGAIVVVLAIIGAVAAGSSDDTTTDRPEATVTPPGSDTTEANNTATTAEQREPTGGVPDAAEAYVEALASEDLSRMGAMLDNSVKGSSAALYATHQIAFVRALGTLGPIPATTQVGEDTITVHSTSYDTNGTEVKDSMSTPTSPLRATGSPGSPSMVPRSPIASEPAILRKREPMVSRAASSPPTTPPGATWR